MGAKMKRVSWLSGLSAASLMVVVGLGPARADDFVYFKSPTGNINCVYMPPYDPSVRPMLRCDINEFTPTIRNVPAQTRDEIEVMGRCTPKRMSTFTVEDNAARGSASCASDSANSEDAGILAYGQTFSRGGFTCQSQPSGMTCTNRSSHGFFLSKASQKLF